MTLESRVALDDGIIINLKEIPFRCMIYVEYICAECGLYNAKEFRIRDNLITRCEYCHGANKIPATFKNLYN